MEELILRLIVMVPVGQVITIPTTMVQAAILAVLTAVSEVKLVNHCAVDGFAICASTENAPTAGTDMKNTNVKKPEELMRS